ncbi:hypothetical protein ACLOJK_027762 [Asimina triloba]
MDQASRRRINQTQAEPSRVVDDDEGSYSGLWPSRVAGDDNSDDACNGLRPNRETAYRAGHRASPQAWTI